MLVLTLKPDERILISDDIAVLLVESLDGKVRLGIEAPRHIIVDREDVRRRRNAGFPAEVKT